MWTGALIGLAAASPPDRTVRLFGVDPDGGGYLERLVVSADGRIVAGVTKNSGKAFLLDTLTWEQVDGATEEEGVLPVFAGDGTGNPCDATGVAVVDYDDDTYDVYVSCNGGEVLRFYYPGAGVPIRDEDFVVDLGEPASAIWYDPWTPDAHAVYVYSLGVDTAPSAIHAIDLAGGLDAAGDFTSFPKQVLTRGLLEGAVVPRAGGGTLILSHGNGNMSDLQLGNNASAAVANASAGGFACTDMAVSQADGTVLCVSQRGAIAKYLPTNRTFTSYGLALDQPRGVCTSPDFQDGWTAVTGNRVSVWELDANGVLLDADDPYYQSPADADNPIQDLVTANGYLFGGGEAGYLHVVTANPWVYPGSVEVAKVTSDGQEEPGTVFANGDVLEITFAVNRPADVVLVDDAYDYTKSFGPAVAVAVETDDKIYPGELQVTVDDTFPEGESNLYLVAVTELGDIGHAPVAITVDNVPGPPGVSAAADENAVTLRLQGIPDADLAHYELYLSDRPFTASEFDTSGPDTFRQPFVLEAAPGADVEHRFGGLVNGTTYYMAARAYDQEGKESRMSRVVSSIPADFKGAAAQAGDPGGSPCDTGAGLAGGWAALIAAWFARRSRAAVPLASAVVVTLAVADAEAADRKEEPWWRQDTTPATANFEIRYGGFTPDSALIKNVYDLKPQNMLQLEVGPQIYRFVEVDLGLGFYQELSFEKVGNTVGSNRTMLTWFPFTADASLRAHFLDEQPVVPYLRYGWDYVLWSDKSGPGGVEPTEVVRGAKFGTHYAVGASLLLDLLQPARASFLEARSGINDSWLTVEWRSQRVDDRKRPWSGPTKKYGWDFSGDMVTVGLKLDW